MGVATGFFAGAVCASVAAFVSAARADEPPDAGARLPLAYADRPITDPAGVLSPVVDFGVAKPGTALPGVPYASSAITVAIGSASGGGDTLGQLSVGAGYAITDDLGVRATFAAIDFGAATLYAGPSIGATYRFLRGEVEVAASLDVADATLHDLGGVVFNPGLPVRVHLGETLRLDLTPSAWVSTVGSPHAVGLAAAVALAWNPLPALHVGATSGMTLVLDASAFGEGVPDTVGVPLGLFAGYAVRGAHGPAVDIDPFIAWPAFFIPGLAGDRTEPGVYDVGVQATYHFYL